MFAICSGTPLLVQARLDEVPQFGARLDPPGLGASPSRFSTLVSSERAVVRRVVWPDVLVAVAADLAADCRRATAQLGRDRPDGLLLASQVGNPNAFLLGQVAAGDRARRRPVFAKGVRKEDPLLSSDGLDLGPSPLPGPHRGLDACAASVTPLAPRSGVNADNATSLFVTHPLANELNELLSLVDQGAPRCCLPQIHRIPEVRALRRSLEPKAPSGGGGRLEPGGPSVGHGQVDPVPRAVRGSRARLNRSSGRRSGRVSAAYAGQSPPCWLP